MVNGEFFETGSREYLRFYFIKNICQKLIKCFSTFQGTKAEVSDVIQLNHGVEESR